MRLTVVPPVDEQAEEAIRAVLHAGGIAPTPTGGRSAWWRAGIDEAVDRASLDYALSPRNTRGATRA